MSDDTSNPDTWRPDIAGWSCDILPWYAEQAKTLPNDANVAEIGIYHGRSILFLASLLWDLGKRDAKLWAIDPCDWGTKPEAWEKGDWATLLQNALSIGPAVELIRLVRAKSLGGRFAPERPFDLVFIDADHTEEAVRLDILAWRPGVKPGGILAGHDYGDGHPGVKRAVDKLISASSLSFYGSIWHTRIP